MKSPDSPNSLISLGKDSAREKWTVGEAYGYCLKVARSHYENFPVASWFLPRKARKHVAAVYSFARGADDLADEPEYRDHRITGLDRWREMLIDAVRGQARHPVFVALGESIRTLDLPVSLLDDLLTAFRMDAVETRYERFDDLLEYSRYSANPIGRLVLWICGRREENLGRLSDAVCTGLQLANFWQDVGVDTRRGRVYLPSEEMAGAGYTLEDLKNEVVDDRFRRLLRPLIERTRDLFRTGQPLGRLVGGGPGFEIRLVCQGGRTILDKIERVDYDVFHRRPEIRTLDKISLFLGTILGRE
jgi:phytoene synthase